LSRKTRTEKGPTRDRASSLDHGRQGLQPQISIGSAIAEKPESLTTSLKRRLRQLCSRRTPGPVVTEILNRELGLSRNLDSYWKLAKREGLKWTQAGRIGRPGHRAIPIELLPEDQRRCKFCGKDRRLVPYVLSKARHVFLCENRCCPECGGKLEVHEVLNKAGKVEARHWAHTLPLPPRNCSVCGVEFRPENIRQCHKKTCSDSCMRIAATRNWEKNHPAEAKDLARRSSRNRQKLVQLGKASLQPKSAKRRKDSESKITLLVRLLDEGAVSLNAVALRIFSETPETAPSLRDTEQAAAAGNEEAIRDLSEKRERIRRLEARMNKFWSNHLHSLEQLPELEGDESLEFTWDIAVHVGDENEDYQIIRVGEREVWRELAFWDNMVRFNEIKDLLKRKYGTRFKSLTPTDGSLDFLTGDHYFRLKTLSWT
jgi:hypothetical protein